MLSKLSQLHAVAGERAGSPFGGDDAAAAAARRAHAERKRARQDFDAERVGEGERNFVEPGAAAHLERQPVQTMAADSRSLHADDGQEPAPCRHLALVGLHFDFEIGRRHDAQAHVARGSGVSIADFGLELHDLSASHPPHPWLAAPEHLEASGAHPSDTQLGDRARHREADQERAAPRDDRGLPGDQSDPDAHHAGDGEIDGGTCGMQMHGARA
ncbi:MAG: hypothetical protein U0263_23215 [Polyangiaceae bacterium]